MKYLELLNRVWDCARKSEKAADALSTASNNSNVQEREARPCRWRASQMIPR